MSSHGSESGGAWRRSPSARDTANTLFCMAEGQRAVDLLQDAEVEVVVLKGAALVGDYFRASERPIQDVDLLVPDRQRVEATRALREHGYQRLETSGRPLGNRLHPAGAWLSSRGVQIDLHWGLGPRHRWKIAYGALFREAQVFQFGQTRSKRLCLEHLILHNALDQAKDEFAVKNKAGRDLARVLGKQVPDWNRLLQTAHAWHCKTALWVVLEHVQRCYAASVPSWLRDALAPSRERVRWIEALLSLEEPLVNQRHFRSRRLRQLVVGGLLSDSWTRFIWAGSEFAALRSADFVATQVLRCWPPRDRARP